MDDDHPADISRPRRQGDRITPLFVATARDRLWHRAASDVCDRIAGVGESGHRIPGHPCQIECDANIRTSAEILLCSIAARRRPRWRPGDRARNLRKDAAGGATSRSPRSRGGSRAATAAARCIRGFAALISGLKAPRDHAIGVTFLPLSSGRGLRCVTPGGCPRLVTLRSFRLKGVEDVEVNLGSLLSVKVRRARKQASRKRCCYQYVLFHLVSSVLL